MTNNEAVNWLINLSADIGKAEHRELWHYEQAIYEIREMIESTQREPKLDEWCTDCKEYDQKRHCCPRWNRVIRETLADMRERGTGKWIYCEDMCGVDGYRCDKCGFHVPWDYTHKFIDFINDYHYCPNCGAMMDDGKENGEV